MSDSDGDKMLLHTNQVRRRHTLTSSGDNNRNSNQGNLNSSNDQSPSGCDGDKTLPPANRVKKNQSLASYGYKNRKCHKGNTNFDNGKTSSDRDGDKLPPPANQVRGKQRSTPDHPAFRNAASLPNDAKVKMQLLATHVTKGQILVENCSCDTQDPWYQNPPGTNMQITTNNFAHMCSYASKYSSLITCNILY